MANPRTRDELLTQFADNTSGDIVEQDHRDFVESTLGVYGAHQIQLANSPISFTSGAGDSVIDIYDETIQRGVTGTAAAGALTAPVDGVYRLAGHLRFGAGLVAGPVDMGLTVNGTRVHETFFVSTGGVEFEKQVERVLSLSAGDVCKLVIEDASAPSTWNIDMATISLTRIG